jgi:hypothetical protein
MLTNNHVMCDVNQIINDNSVSNLGVTQSSSVYGSAGTNLNILSNN